VFYKYDNNFYVNYDSQHTTFDYLNLIVFSFKLKSSSHAGDMTLVGCIKAFPLSVLRSWEQFLVFPTFAHNNNTQKTTVLYL